jgi:hypothetical protein
MNRLTATVARAHLNACAWHLEQVADEPGVADTSVKRTLEALALDFYGIVSNIEAEQYELALELLRGTVRSWEGHGFNLDELGAALLAYGTAMQADAIVTSVRMNLSNALVAVLGRAREIASHSS